MISVEDFLYDKNTFSSYTFKSGFKEIKFLLGNAKKYFKTEEEIKTYNKVLSLFDKYKEFDNKEQNHEIFEEKFQKKKRFYFS